MANRPDTVRGRDHDPVSAFPVTDAAPAWYTGGKKCPALPEYRMMAGFTGAVRSNAFRFCRRRGFLPQYEKIQDFTMKRIWINRLSVCLLVCLAAIGTAACSQPQPQTAEPHTPAVQTDHYTAAVFYYDYSDAYIASVRSKLTRDLVNAGIPYMEFDAASSQSAQNGQIDDAISRGADILIVNVVQSGNTDVADAICLKAYRQEIPVIFFNRPVEEDGDEGVVLDFYKDVAFVGTDPAEGGHIQGNMIGSYLKEHYSEVDLNGDGSISYTLFKGQASNAEAIYRTKYAVEDADAILEEAGYPPLQYFNENSVDNFQLDLTGKWSASAAHEYMMSNLARYNEENGNMIELIICNNDNMAEGAIKALQAVGYNLGTDRCVTIPVFGVDATDAAKQLIAEGKMTGTVVQDAEGMAECVCRLTIKHEQGLDLLEGMEEYERDTEHGLNSKLYIPYEEYVPE